MEEKPLRDWHSGIFDCFEDPKTCCYGFWCCPCLACTVSNGFGENYCLPLCDIFSPAVMVACGIPLCVPPAALSIRSAVRNRFGIKGSLCKDIAVSCFCMWCAWCQMHREMRNLKKTPTVVNMQPQTVVNVQPVSSVTVSINNMQSQAAIAQTGATVSKPPLNQIDQKPPKESGKSNAGSKAIGKEIGKEFGKALFDGFAF